MGIPPRRKTRLDIPQRELYESEKRLTPPAADLLEHLFEVFGSQQIISGQGVDGAVDTLITVARQEGRNEVLGLLYSIANQPR